MNKISHYFSTLEITRGFFIALLSSAFIYLEYWHLSHPLLNTLLGLISLYLLLASNSKTWFFTGAFIGLFWFWWIALSLKHYNMLWAVPIEILIIMLSYGFILWSISKIASSPITIKWCCGDTKSCIISLGIKAIGLLLLSYIHPFSFDWFKPELLFVDSYFGIQKWQFFFILLGIILTIWRQNLLYLFLMLAAYSPSTNHTNTLPHNIALITTHTSVQDKWNKTLHPAQFDAIYTIIDKAIAEKKSLIILPESVFPVFLKRNEVLFNTLKEKAKYISIVTGGLYWDGQTPRNSTYIFTDDHVNIANKVVLVPFGESNPLPDFLSDWVNKVFYDGAVDYKASTKVTDYSINGITYRNAICFEATSEKLYEGNPENMIVLSNNGWFTPSIEPTLQKLLLLYYNKKYGTTIYHSINMSSSYTIQEGVIFEVQSN